MNAPASLTSIKPADLPAPPQEAIRIVHACTRTDVTNRQLGEIISHDPVLTAELLRVVNSAFFGFRVKVRSAAHAVTVLGHRALRNLALCIAMRDALSPDAIPGLDIRGFWESALRRAVSARVLSDLAELDGDECFSAGLLQDFGLLVLFYLYPEQTTAWEHLSRMTPDDRYAAEQSLFRVTHEKIGLLLAQTWGLPEDLVDAIGYHHNPDAACASETSGRLAMVCRCADWMATVFTSEETRPVIHQCRTLLGEAYGIEPGLVHDRLDHVAQGMKDAASALNFRVGTQTEFSAIVREANLQLAEENLSYQEITWELEHALEERDRYATELNSELELAREVQRHLLPTGIVDCPGLWGINISARQVSGDFYDYFRLPDGRIYFCIADVSGKGMNAALLMAKASSLFHCLGKGVDRPAQLMGMLNREICETSVRGMFVTMAAGIIDPAEGSVTLANAGHLPLLHVIAGGAIKEYPALGPPLGVLPDSRFAEESFSLQDGSLYLCTDGIIEARTASGRELGMQGFQDLIRRYARLPSHLRLQRILEQVRGNKESASDDLTLLLIEDVGGDGNA